ncbi:hypothetical protein MLD38_003440 [Melastoma candidum]|uniref:Uncharacterized protein n=1 Tax=Melastoma candidum TaxID=119954 RepID=A0ACB9S3Y4_9MYRT|nr:hypothetical protein MLD38_003440 [Melastoma candidum]
MDDGLLDVFSNDEEQEGAGRGLVNLIGAGVDNANNEDGVFEPYVGMEFESEAAAKSFYDEYARQLGFSSKSGQRNDSRANGGIISLDFLCAREGSKRKSHDSCNAMIRIEQRGQEKWTVTKVVKEHSHLVFCPYKVHNLPARRETASMEDNLLQSWIVSSDVMRVSSDGNPTSMDINDGSFKLPVSRANHSVKDAATDKSASLRRQPIGNYAQNMLDYLKKMQAKNPGFFYAVQLDEQNRLANIFWADARSRHAYSHFGDAVILETLYRLCHYRVPFAPFTGVNHHGQVILFGCALLLDDSEESYVWLFKTFLIAMNDRPPLSLVTDQDRVIKTAVGKVFPGTRHCISKWHVLREGQDKLAHVCVEYPGFLVDLYNCINTTETVEEFESSWKTLLDKYNLESNDWLQSIYKARTQWVPVFFRDSFFGVVYPNLGIESSFFDGFVNYHTTLPLFFRQYENAIESWFEKETEADFDTMCSLPVLKTPSPMEKQAADLYTKTIFTKFQEELVETFQYTANRVDDDGILSTFSVVKFEDNRKSYKVMVNYTEMKASCSCRMFEYCGILCRHVLTVFTVSNILTLPEHYIVKRWTRNAKVAVGLNDTDELLGMDTLTARYNVLCREAMKYAEDGAAAMETYNVALDALKDVGRKISAIKKIIKKAPRPTSHVNTAGCNGRKGSAKAVDPTPFLWPRQDEVSGSFNLNCANATAWSAAEPNIPRMSPLFIHRDNGPTESMAVLPCLKSMTWVMENKSAKPENRVAIISIKLQDYSTTPAAERDVKFRLSRLTLEPMLRSMSYISEQLSTPDNKVAVINLKLQETQSSTGESEVKFQVSRDALGAMLRSMAYIREQLSIDVVTTADRPNKRKRNLVCKRAETLLGRLRPLSRLLSLGGEAAFGCSGKRSRISDDGAGEEDEEDAREHQRQAGARDEEREVRAWYKTVLKTLRNSKGKLIIIANNCPLLRKSEIGYYPMLARLGCTTTMAIMWIWMAAAAGRAAVGGHEDLGPNCRTTF